LIEAPAHSEDNDYASFLRQNAFSSLSMLSSLTEACKRIGKASEGPLPDTHCRVSYRRFLLS
jgi:hypothetical protein